MRQGVHSVSSLNMLLMCFVVLFFNCEQKYFSSEEKMMKYLKDENHDYFTRKTVNGVEFNLLYRPIDLLVKQELGDERVTKSKLKELREKYERNIYLNLTMSIEDKELLNVVPKSRSDFSRMVHELSFGMGDKVHLYNNQRDTIYLADYVYPRTFGMSQSTSLMFVYPRNNAKFKGENLNFTIEDFGLKTGEVKIKIPLAIIKNEPRLNFKEIETN